MSDVLDFLAVVGKALYAGYEDLVRRYRSWREGETAAEDGPERD